MTGMCYHQMLHVEATCPALPGPKSLRPVPSQGEIDCYHTHLLDSFKETFDKHKAAYGWSQKTLMIV